MFYKEIFAKFLVLETCHSTAVWDTRETWHISTNLFMPVPWSPDIRRKEQCVPMLEHDRYAVSIFQVEAYATTCVCKRDVWRRIYDHCTACRGTHCGQLGSWLYIHKTSFTARQQNPRLLERWSCTDSTCTSPELFLLQVFMKTAFYSCLFLTHFITAAMIYSLSKVWTCNNRILKKLH